MPATFGSPCQSGTKSLDLGIRDQEKRLWIGFVLVSLLIFFIGTALSSQGTPEKKYKIAFGSRPDDGLALYIVDEDGANLKRLTGIIHSCEGPVWNPDGTRIAFGNNPMYVMDADGQNMRQLTKHEGPGERVCAWSPDGKKLLYESFQPNRTMDICVMRPDGKNQKNLTKSSNFDRSPAWSPNGREIAWESVRNNNSDICVMTARGGRQKNLTEKQVNILQDGTRAQTIDTSPAWSPDSKKIAFVSQVNDGRLTHNIYVMDTNGRGRKKLSANPEGVNARKPAWSPDGKKIAFEVHDDNGNSNICVVDADGRNQKTLTTIGKDHTPTWSPDGKKIAFESNRNICVMDADGQNLKRLTDNKKDNMDPVWCPIEE